MIILFLCLTVLEILQYRELKKIGSFVQEKTQEPMERTPPKGRNSFVVKRMEERLKEALYE